MTEAIIERIDTLETRAAELHSRQSDTEAPPTGVEVQELQAIEHDMVEARYEYQQLEEGSFEPSSSAVSADLGLLATMAQFLVEVRAEMNRELDRDDLTPYMWDRLLHRKSAIDTVLGVLGGKRTRRFPLEPVPTFVVHSEYDDGTLDIEEAIGRDEARATERARIDEGAVVYTYMVIPEHGTRLPVFEPITPIENQQRTIGRKKFERLVRMKGGEKFLLPDGLRDIIVVDGPSRFEKVRTADGRLAQAEPGR